ncbi:hypothetical protein Pogu_0780 [Pyrobaculum oguniense TE7]|uniref:Uncharacterized protein n=1 Tax=Pyrobaculum oguniense (strain DSM 13380 / JCM 10595 / TE7) TaxID=698757 RepID=H6Q877_PYROT|nr:hypothetical protein Pogu_0780 [Pyrobaculum oguniense TE7]
MNTNKIILIVTLAAALAFAQTVTASAGANATLSDPAKFHLWLKCRAVELYINATDVGLRGNVTLPPCEELVQNFTSNRLVFIIGRAGVRPLPMIGMGELKALNASDPHGVFTQLREIRRQALLNLPKQINKTVDAAYREIETGNGTEPLERAVLTLTRVRSLLEKVNASQRAVDVLSRNIEFLNNTRQFIAEARTAPYDKLAALLERIQNHTDLPHAKKVMERYMVQTRATIEERAWKELEEIYSNLNATSETEMLAVLNKSMATLEKVTKLLERVNASKTAVEAVRRNILLLNETKQAVESLLRGDYEKARAQFEKLRQILGQLPEWAKKALEEKINKISKAVQERGSGTPAPPIGNSRPQRGNEGKAPGR